MGRSARDCARHRVQNGRALLSARPLLDQACTWHEAGNAAKLVAAGHAFYGESPAPVYTCSSRDGRVGYVERAAQRSSVFDILSRGASERVLEHLGLGTSEA